MWNYRHYIDSIKNTTPDASAVIFYVDLYQNIYVKFICTVLCNFKDPTWILCKPDFYV